MSPAVLNTAMWFIFSVAAGLCIYYLMGYFRGRR